MATRKSTEEQKMNKFLNRASGEVNGFAELLQCFERNISITGRSKTTRKLFPRRTSKVRWICCEQACC
ncbi:MULTISPECIES: hypothetical protein [Chryseobacterium]|uniref:hypothetical protein n=1 Tax=Chryseobacterium sp. R2A-55 TaxID=2744445 RepID=UPI001F425EEF|nr:hypothetical protein [Chryseobacterium sp. R2A-55]